MLTQRIIEYLFYLLAFILLMKFSEAATVNLAEDGSQQMPGKRDALKRAFGECDSGFSWMCLKIEFVKLIERVGDEQELNLMPGISVVKDANATEPKTADIMAEVARSFPNDPSSRLNGYILSKLENILKTRYLRFKLIDDNTVAEARSAVETGRKGKFGKKGGMEALIAAGMMMKGTMMAMGMGAIALLAGKALMTALMALTLSGVVGLKSLAGGGKSTTYEIVAKPIYTSSHSHSVSHDDGGHGGHYGGGQFGAAIGGGGHGGSGYGGYGRSLNLDMQNQLVANGAQ